MPPEYIEETIKDFKTIFPYVEGRLNHPNGGKYTGILNFSLEEFIHQALTQTHNNALKVAVEEIDREWLAIDLTYNNKENWDKELIKFSLFMQGKSRAIKNIKEKMI